MDIDRSLRDIALLCSRLTLGGSMTAHGAQKLFGVQGGPGLNATEKTMESLGFSPAERYAPLVAGAEITSGTLMMLGVLGPIGPALMLSVMLVAIETVHRPKGYWQKNGGYELNTMYMLNALLLANEGFGSYSLDEVFGIRKKLRPLHGWIALLGGAAAAMLVLNRRTPRIAQEAPQTARTSQNETAASDPKIGATV